MSWFKKTSAITIMLILAICLTRVQSAFADDGPTSTDDGIGEETPITELDEGQNVPVTEVPTNDTFGETGEGTLDSVTEEINPIDETAPEIPPEPNPQSEVPNTEISVAEILLEIPDNTNIIVLDENGTSIPLAAQAAETIVQIADPIWCPESAVPPYTPGTQGCSESFTSFENLLDNMNDAEPLAWSADYSHNGVIYLEQTTNSATTITSEISITSATYTNLFNNFSVYDLTIQGGWDINTGIISGVTTFDNNNNASLNIGSALNPWIGNITISDLLFQDNNINTASSLFVSTTSGNVTLENVTVNNSTNNSTVSVLTDSGNVSIFDLDIANSNSASGADVTTASGNITLDDVDITAQTNGNTATLQTTNGNITIQNGSVFDGIGNNSGFSATSINGTITIEGSNGAPILFSDAQGPGAANNAGASLDAPSIILNHATSEMNDGSGIVISNAVVNLSLNNVIASNNGINGITINASGNVFIDHTNTEDNVMNGIAITNSSNVFISNTTASSNTASGLTLNHTDDISISNTSTDGNGSNGMIFNNAEDITVDNSSNADTNGINGIVVLNSDSARFSNVFVDNNNRDGIFVQGTALVSLESVSATNNGTDIPGGSGNGGFSNDLGSGVRVIGTGTTLVQLAGGVFNNNERYGIEVINTLNNSIYVSANPTSCIGNGGGCYNRPTIFDNTAPSVTPVITGTAGSNGWYTSDVTVSWEFTDSESGIYMGCSPVILTDETTGTLVSCVATNLAGLSAQATVTVMIDKTGPSANLGVLSGTPGSNGWYTSDIVAQTSGIDSISSPATCTADQTINMESSSITVNGSCTNQAGITADAAPLTLKIDKTGPTLSLPIEISADATDEFGAFVGFVANSLDNLDPLPTVTCLPASGSFFANGTTTVTCSAEDEAGNITQGNFNVVVNGHNKPSTGSTGGEEDPTRNEPNTYLIPLTGGAQELDIVCPPNNFSYQTPGISIVFVNLCGYQVSIEKISSEDLSHEIPDNYTLINGFTISILKDGSPLDLLPADAMLDLMFDITEDNKDKPVHVLFWDGVNWVELNGVVDGNIFKVSESFTGSFVFVEEK